MQHPVGDAEQGLKRRIWLTIEKRLNHFRAPLDSFRLRHPARPLHTLGVATPRKSSRTRSLLERPGSGSAAWHT